MGIRNHPLASPLVLPPHVFLMNVVPFPLKRHIGYEHTRVCTN